MFNDTVCPYVKSMNQELRKTHLEDFRDFEDKTVELKASSNSFQKDGLFCLVDFIETNEVYIFKIKDFTDDKITLDSFLKINRDTWVGLDCKENITKPGLMKSNALIFIAGIKRIIFPNYDNYEKNLKFLQVMKLKVKGKSKIIASLHGERKELEGNFMKELNLNKKHYEAKITGLEEKLLSTEEEYKIKLKTTNEECEEEAKLKINSIKEDYEKRLKKTHSDVEDKITELQEGFNKYKENSEQKIVSLNQNFEEQLILAKQEYVEEESKNIVNNLNEFIAIMFFIIPIVLNNVFNKK